MVAFIWHLGFIWALCRGAISSFICTFPFFPPCSLMAAPENVTASCTSAWTCLQLSLEPHPSLPIMMAWLSLGSYPCWTGLPQADDTILNSEHDLGFTVPQEIALAAQVCPSWSPLSLPWSSQGAPPAARAASAPGLLPWASGTGTQTGHKQQHFPW